MTFTKLVGVTWTPAASGGTVELMPRVIAGPPLVVVIDRELVLAACLPRHPHRVADDVTVVDARTIVVRLVDELRGIPIEVAVGNRLLHALVPEGVMEPESVVNYPGCRWRG